jgi:hypothetical protein
MGDLHEQRLFEAPPALAFNGHSEEVRCTLEEGNVVGAEFVLGPTAF